MENQTVVANLFQLTSLNGKFDLDMKKLHHANAKVPRHFVEEYNANDAWKHSGKIYVIDDEATKQYHEDATVLKELRKEKDDTLNDAADMVANAVKKLKRKK